VVTIEAKNPLVKGGFKGAVTDPKEVRRLFNRPSVLIGVAPPVGVLVVDIDHHPEQGLNAPETLAKLLGRFPELLAAPRTRTGSGGFHLWLSYDPREALVQRDLMQGVNTRVGGKGYVIVPPSIRGDGGRYVFEGDERALAIAPAALLGVLRRDRPVSKPKSSANGAMRRPQQSVHGGLSPYVAAAMNAELRAVASASEGGRNNQLNKAAFSLAGYVASGDLQEGQTRADLLAAALAAGLDEQEAQTTIESGFRAGLELPRDIPEPGGRSGNGRASTDDRAGLQDDEPEPKGGPAAGLPPGFRLTECGVEKWCEPKRDDDEGEWRWVCSHLEVAALTRDGHSEGWGRLLRMTDPDGHVHEWAAPSSMLATDGGELRAHLLSLGLDYQHTAFGRAALVELISRARPELRAQSVARVGWHGRAYVLARLTVTKSTEESTE
jgi:hypothetical protein